jgi:hypothetical protein
MGPTVSTSTGLIRHVVGLIAAVALVLAFAAPVAAAGDSTPGVTVTAVNPAGSRVGSDLNISLSAHTELSTTADPSCRPQDRTLVCWGSLLLRIPKFGDLAVGNFEVHRVAVGDISCGDEGGEDDGCGDHEMSAMGVVTGPVLAQVNGVAYVKWPGNTGLAVGTKLQLKFTLTDNGTASYVDTVVVQVNLFVAGPDKPLLYQSGPELIRQVTIRFVDDDPAP